MDADLEALSLHELVEAVSDAQSVEVGRQAVSGCFDHLVTDVSGKIGGLLGLDAHGVWQEFSCSASHLIDVFGLVEPHHVDECVVEGLHAWIDVVVDGGEVVSQLLEFFACAPFLFGLHKICSNN